MAQKIDPVLAVAVDPNQEPGRKRFCERVRVHSKYSCGQCYTCGFNDRDPVRAGLLQAAVITERRAKNTPHGESVTFSVRFGARCDPGCAKCKLIRLAKYFRSEAEKRR